MVEMVEHLLTVHPITIMDILLPVIIIITHTMHGWT